MKTSDLYIVFPCKHTDKPRYTDFSGKQSEEAMAFIDKMMKRSEIELSRAWFSRIVRRNLGEIELVIKDNHDKKEKAFGVETHFKASELNLFYLVVPNVGEGMTDILEQSFNNDHKITINGKDVKDWLKGFGLSITGKPYYCVCTTKLDEDKKLKIIASEANPESAIKSKDIMQVLKESIAQYEGFDCFASRSGVIFEMENFDQLPYSSSPDSNDHQKLDRLKSECEIIFILEIIILKISAFHLANNEVVKQINKEKFPRKNRSKIPKNLLPSIDLWGTQHFRYFTAQTLAKHIEQAFELNCFVEQHDRNRKHLEQLNLISSEKASKTISYTLILLTVIQVLLACLHFLQ